MDYILDTNYKKQNMPVEPPTPRPYEYENKGSNNPDLTMINLIYKEKNDLLKYCNKLEYENKELIRNNKKLLKKVDKLYEIYDIIHSN